MLCQGPQGSSTPGNQVLPLRQVNVLAIYVETNHQYRHSEYTAVACGADWIDTNTFPPAVYPPPMTRRLFNTWKTGFVIKVSKCTEPNHEQMCFWRHCIGMRGWLSRSKHLSICGISSTKEEKAPQHLEIRFCRYDKSMFWPFMLSQTTNFLILLQ